MIIEFHHTTNENDVTFAKYAIWISFKIKLPIKRVFVERVHLIFSHKSGRSHF